MEITLTGTPGTGKTTVAEELSDRGFDVVHLTAFFQEKDIGEVVNDEREIDIEEMINELKKEEFSGDTVIEGHLSHHYPSDICIVLRCRPDILKQRLSKRNYSDKKIEENVEAEKIDVVLSEAVRKQDIIIEVDTTEKQVEDVVDMILSKIEKGESDYGNVDWTKFL